ncbi:MAG: hypothetical protein COB85_04165, partial [Bacteroidetes bacterium]
MKKRFAIIGILSLFLYSASTFVFADQPSKEEVTATHASTDEGHYETEEVHKEHGQGEHSGGGHGGLEPLLFVIIALIIGAAVRHFLRNIPLPFTVLLLLIGIGLGVMAGEGLFDGALESFKIGIHWAGNIDPHLILYVFLPILIFEAAFALDVHVFKKTLGNAVILAVPGIVVALVLTAALVMATEMLGIGFSGWNWAYALMFGSVVSATDPVAVVALLKELGASKKLGTLIEGESLLNDGTAIVIFMVFYAPLVAMGGVAESGSPFIEFLYVALGGILLGIVIGYIVVAWVKRVFNDFYVEISAIVAAAYLVFYAAEDFFHVSGVLGLVSYGLVMAGVGKTRISPEVGHFLHEFWELAAFIANVLIFIIVGVVIAERAVFDATANDYLLLLIIYIGIHAVRAVVILMFYPIMRRTGYGLPKKDAIVVWYGALRGAIGLALALMVAGIEPIQIATALEISVDQAKIVINQFLFLISGVVALTLLVNATTIKLLVNGLGLTKIPAVKATMMDNAFKQLTNETEKTVELLKGDKFMSGANWNAVREYLPKMSALDISDEERAEMDTMAETRRRILEKEKSSYWHQFGDGLLGAIAVRRLADGVSELLDDGGKIPLTERGYMDKLWSSPKFLNKLQGIPLLGTFAKNELSNSMSMSYDIARGFVVAQEEVVKLVESMAEGDETTSQDDMVQKLQVEINENRMRGLNFLKNMREANPEIAAAIETKQAIRSVLNKERVGIKKLKADGRIEADECERMIESVEERMKRLMDSPPSIELPDSIELLKEVSWLQGLEASVVEKVVSIVETKIYGEGDVLMKAGDPGDSMFVIARGTVKVIVGNDIVVDILGPGSVIGEMAVLSGVPRTATITADTPVTALSMKADGMQELMSSSKELEEKLWNLAGVRFAENLLSKIEPYQSWRQIQFREWLAEGKIVTKSSVKEPLDVREKEAVLIAGTCYSIGEEKTPL